MFVAGCRFLGLLMPDELRSPIKHHLVLHRIDPEQGVARFYSLMIECDLFGTIQREIVVRAKGAPCRCTRRPS
jgi:hypothetical protein